MSDVRDHAAREWGSKIDFIAPADVSEGMTSLAMRYFAGKGAQPRNLGSCKRRLSDNGDALGRLRVIHKAPNHQYTVSRWTRPRLRRSRSGMSTSRST